MYNNESVQCKKLSSLRGILSLFLNGMKKMITYQVELTAHHRQPLMKKAFCF